MRAYVVIRETRGSGDQVLMLRNEEGNLFLPWAEGDPIAVSALEAIREVLPRTADLLTDLGVVLPTTERPYADWSMSPETWSMLKDTLDQGSNAVLISRTEALSRTNVLEADRQILQLLQTGRVSSP